MADFKDVYIGDGTLITQDMLSDMANNDQYIFEEMTAAAWGIQARKNVTANVTVATTDYSIQAAQLITSFPVTLSEGRMYRTHFSAKSFTTSGGAGYNRLVIATYLAQESMGGCISNIMTTGYTYNIDSYDWIFKPKVFGEQTIYYYAYWVYSTPGITGVINAAATSPIQCWIDDVGAEV